MKELVKKTIQPNDPESRDDDIRTKEAMMPEGVLPNVKKKKYGLLIALLCLMGGGFIGCNDSGQPVQYKTTATLEKRVINPWTWQDKYGFAQANEVTGARRMMFCAGQISVDENGMLLFPGDMEKQMNQILDNMELLLKQADYTLSDVVRFTYYTTNIKAFVDANHVLGQRFNETGCRPATSLIGVASLARPGCVVEIEATLMK